MLAIYFIALSAILYILDIEIFQNAKEIFFWFMMSLAFLPFEVFLVSVVINRLISEKERRSKRDKLNMVIGAFYSEVGSSLLRQLLGFNVLNGEMLSMTCAVVPAWTGAEFSAARAKVRTLPIVTDAVDAGGNMEELKLFLVGKRVFMLGLLENQNVLEHEEFTDVLWAVFHLTDELAARNEVSALSAPDRAHLRGDIARAYKPLITEWLSYMCHIKTSYPYLFSLAVRMNPFNPAASPVVK